MATEPGPENFRDVIVEFKKKAWEQRNQFRPIVLRNRAEHEILGFSPGFVVMDEDTSGENQNTPACWGPRPAQAEREPVLPGVNQGAKRGFTKSAKPRRRLNR